MPHSFLPPSGASAWLRCASWPTMNLRYPQDDSPESIEGTAAHWVAFEPLQGRTCPTIIAPNGSVITKEMTEGAELLAETVELRMKGMALHIEEGVSIERIHKECYGTPDIWGFDLATCRLEIIDYKFGHGFVDEYLNAQGFLYALGILAKIKDLLIGNPRYVAVSFTIVQPRCYVKGEPVRTWTFTLQDFESETLLAELQAAAALAYQPEPTATTNPGCKYCPGRHACSALQEAAYSDAEFSNNRQPFDLSPNAAALELKMLERSLERLEARVEGLKQLTLSHLQRGEKIPYYHIERTKPRATWNVTVEQIVLIGELLGKNLSKPGALTPAQAIKEGIDEAVIKEYSFVPSGSLKLVADNPNDVRRIFGSGE